MTQIFRFIFILRPTSQYFLDFQYLLQLFDLQIRKVQFLEADLYLMFKAIS